MMDESKPGTRDFMRVISDHNLTQLVDKPTHIHPTPTLLDLILTNLNDRDHQSSVSVLPEPIADHQPVILSAPVRRQRRPRPAPVTTRPWRRVDWDALCLRLLTADWEPLYSAAAFETSGYRREAGGVHGRLECNGRRDLPSHHGVSAAPGLSVAERRS